MGLENPTFISDFVPANPTGSDPRSQGDDHIRNIKGAIQNTFPNIDGAMTSTQDQLNYVLDVGTKMLFMQAAAPTGWTKDVTHDNKALRIVSGTGGGSAGTVDFTTVFTTATTTTADGEHTPVITVSDHILIISEIPAHTHFDAGVEVSGGSGERTAGSGTQRSTSSTGGGLGHDHPASADLVADHTHTSNLDVKYVDAIICTKDAY